MDLDVAVGATIGAGVVSTVGPPIGVDGIVLVAGSKSFARGSGVNSHLLVFANRNLLPSGVGGSAGSEDISDGGSDNGDESKVTFGCPEGVLGWGGSVVRGAAIRSSEEAGRSHMSWVGAGGAGLPSLPEVLA